MVLPVVLLVVLLALGALVTASVDVVVATCRPRIALLRALESP